MDLNGKSSRDRWRDVSAGVSTANTHDLNLKYSLAANYLVFFSPTVSFAVVPKWITWSLTSLSLTRSLFHGCLQKDRKLRNRLCLTVTSDDTRRTIKIDDLRCPDWFFALVAVKSEMNHCATRSMAIMQHNTQISLSAQTPSALSVVSQIFAVFGNWAPSITELLLAIDRVSIAGSRYVCRQFASVLMIEPLCLRREVDAPWLPLCNRECKIVFCPEVNTTWKAREQVRTLLRRMNSFFRNQRERCCYLQGWLSFASLFPRLVGNYESVIIILVMNSLSKFSSAHNFRANVRHSKWFSATTTRIAQC